MHKAEKHNAERKSWRITNHQKKHDGNESVAWSLLTPKNKNLNVWGSKNWIIEIVFIFKSKSEQSNIKLIIAKIIYKN